MRRFLLRLVTAFRRGRAEQDLAREVASHLAILEEEYTKRGFSQEAARFAARRAFGGIEQAKELQREARSFVWFDDTRRDLQYAGRMLRRSPGFAVVAILTMALGIGTTTTLFSLSYGVLLRPLPWPDSDRLVRMQETRGGNQGRVPVTITNATYLAWQEAPSTIEEIGGWMRSRSMTLTGNGEAERLQVGTVTPSLLRALRAHAFLGRTFVDEDAKVDSDVAILGFGLWQRRFGGRADIVGQTIRLDRRPHTIIGVMSRDFVFPDGETHAWVPAVVFPVQAGGGSVNGMIFPALARLRPGATIEQATAEVNARARSAPDLATAGLALFGSTGEIAVRVASARDVATVEVRPGLLILLAAVGLLFVTAIASLVALQLSRVARRRREIAVRVAMGAGALRLTRQWLAESALLGFAGGGAGLLLAALLHRGLPFVLATNFPRVAEVRLDIRIALFATAMTAFVTFVCGMAPAMRGRGALLEALSADGGPTSGTVTRSRAVRARMAIMVGQVAIACVLLAGAGLLARSYLALVGADRGFDAHGLLTSLIPIPPQSTFLTRMPLLEALEQRLRAVPGVTHVAFGNALPFVTAGSFRGLTIPSPKDPAVKIEVQTFMRAVSPDYFDAMRLRVIRGRSIGRTDTVGSPPVVVVNRSFAGQYLGAEALGQRLPLFVNRRLDWEVVGVVDDMRQGSVSGPGVLGTAVTSLGGVRDAPQPELFFSSAQWQGPISDLVLIVRSSGDPASLAPTLRKLVRDEDPALALDSVMTMEDRITSSLTTPRTYAVFLGGFAIFALLVAGVGLFGVLSYTTVQRGREIGVRAALGAGRRDILGLVLKQAMAMTLTGIAVGLVAAFSASRALSTLLYGISTRDPISFIAVPVILVVVALIACATPAWRAVRIDPLVALRYE